MKNMDKKFNVLAVCAFIAILVLGGKIQTKIEVFLYSLAGDSPILQILAWMFTYIGGTALALFLFYELFSICEEWERRGKNEEK